MRIKSKIWHIARYISSLRFSICLFLILATLSVLGTFIEQDQSLGYYQLNYPENNMSVLYITWRHIVFLGLNHVYSTSWFFVLLALFFLSLLLCTFSTQFPMLKNARRWNFLQSQSSMQNKIHYCDQLKNSSLSNFAFVLSSKNYCIFQRGSLMYSYKGLTGRIAPIFVHFSIIFTLIGSMIGLTGGFMAQEIVPSNEMFHVQNFVKSGYFSILPSSFLGIVDDFFLTFNQDQSVQQFFSSISLIDSKGNIFLRQLVSVNTPLKSNGVTLYQTDWRINALRLKIGSSNLLVKPLQRSDLSNMSSSPYWFCYLAIGKKHNILIVIPSLNDKLLIYDNMGSLIKITDYGSWNVIYGIPVAFKEIMSSTGLQAKCDPGINLTYLGFFILMTSALLSYTSYSQVWCSKNVDRFYFAGETNRALLKFEDEIAAICKQYSYLCRFSQ